MSTEILRSSREQKYNRNVENPLMMILNLHTPTGGRKCTMMAKPMTWQDFVAQSQKPTTTPSFRMADGRKVKGTVKGLPKEPTQASVRELVKDSGVIRIKTTIEELVPLSELSKEELAIHADELTEDGYVDKSVVKDVMDGAIFAAQMERVARREITLEQMADNIGLPSAEETRKNGEKGLARSKRIRERQAARITESESLPEPSTNGQTVVNV